MTDQANGFSASDFSAANQVADDDQNEKSKFSEQMSKGAQDTFDDPTRTNLHTGDSHSGRLNERAENEEGNFATPGPDAPQPDQNAARTSDDDPKMAQASVSPESQTSAPPPPSNSQAYRSSVPTGSDGSDAPSSQPAPQTAESIEPAAPSSAAATAQNSDSQDSRPQPSAENHAPEEISLAGDSVAENAAGAVVGTLSFTDDDKGDSHSFEVSDERFEVSDGVLRLKKGVSLDHEAASSVDVEVRVTDADGAVATETFTVEVTDVQELSISSGFHARYFDVDHELQELSDIDWSADPTHEDVKSEINYADSANSFWEGGSTDTFGVEITGSVHVEEGGTYTFHLGGDDGAVLFINGKPVIENDDLHDYETATGEIDLGPGTHHIEVRYFENYGHAGLKLEWDGPGTDGVELLSAPDISEAQTVSGTPLALNVDMIEGSLPDNASLTLDGLPAGTVVQSGSESVFVDASGAADITDFDTSVLTITPPSDFVGEIEASLSVIDPDTEGGQGTAGQSFTIDVNPAETTPATAELHGGFHASYYDVDYSVSELDDIKWDAPPTHEEMVADIDYENSAESFWEEGTKDTFAARLEGEVTIEEGGLYTFYAGADDGVAVYINGEPVVSNDGLHSYKTKSGKIELEPGTYDIEVRYFENTGHAGLTVEWDGPDTDGRELIKADADTAIEENGTLEVGIDLSGASDQAVISLEGLPAGTILSSGDNAVLSEGKAVDITDWNMDFLEISPPPGYEGEITGEIVITDTAFNGASVTSSTDFSIQVGDYETSGGALVQEEPDYIRADMAALPQGDSAWDADAGDEPASDESEEDVMSEAVIHQESHEMSSVNTDTYERADW